jgi:AcrR family transcriptional regulator
MSHDTAMSNELSIRRPRSAMLSDGRANQKRRTQQALRDAALALFDAGQQPTLQQIADKAMVSRATAYRYFSSVEALIHDAAFDRAVAQLDDVFAQGDDPVEAIGRAAEMVNGVLLNDEAGTHIIERSFMQVWLDNAADARPPRPGRRMKYIEPIVARLADRLGRDAQARLRIGLAMVMGSEAVLAMRDVAGASVESAIAAGRWAAHALVMQALAEEARRARRKTAARRRRTR